MIYDTTQGTLEEQIAWWRTYYSAPPKHWLRALSEQYAASWPDPPPEPMTDEEAERIG